MYLWWRPCSYQIFLSEEILLNKNLRLKTLQIKCIITTQGMKWSCFYFFEIQNVQCMLHFFFMYMCTLIIQEGCHKIVKSLMNLLGIIDALMITNLSTCTGTSIY